MRQSRTEAVKSPERNAFRQAKMFERVQTKDKGHMTCACHSLVEIRTGCQLQQSVFHEIGFRTDPTVSISLGIFFAKSDYW